MTGDVLPPAPVPQHEHDTEEIIARELGKALGERKVRLTDRRLIIMFVFVVVVGAFFLHQAKAQQDQRDHDFATLQRALHVNCDQEQFIVSKANAYYLAQIDAVGHRTDLKPSDKDVLIRNYQQALFPSLRCDLLPGGD